MKHAYYFSFVLIGLVTLAGIFSYLTPDGIFWNDLNGQARTRISGQPISDPDSVNSIQLRIKPPEGFIRVSTPQGSFGHWLRNLRLKSGRPAVRLYNGALKVNQFAHFAVLDIDTGNKDLQQCADAVMRLRAEYLFKYKHFSRIQFNFTDGVRASYKLWRKGYRPIIPSRGKTRWLKKAKPDYSYRSFRKYLTIVFSYAGTYSLSQELKPRPVSELQIGDVFIKGGFPGHAIIVMDLAQNQNGEKAFLLAQSYMPAQDIHILKNISEPGSGPWYFENFGDVLNTPEWDFNRAALKRFPR